MQENVIDIKVIARDLASKTFQQVNKSITGLRNPLSLLKKGFQGVTGVVKNVVSNVFSLKGALAGIGAGLAIQKLDDFASRAGRVQDIQNGFARSFGNVEGSLNDLRKASKGTISDFDLMLSANKAALLGVTKDSGTLAKLLEAARLRGRELGLTTTQAFDDIVTGIGRGSPLILDNLGIKIPDAFKEATEAMSETEKQQALVNLVIEDGAQLASEYGDQQLSLADRSAQLNANFRNFLDDTLVKLTPVFEGLFNILQAIIPAVQQLAEGVGPVLKQLFEEIHPIVSEIFLVLKSLAEQILPIIGPLFEAAFKVALTVIKEVLGFVNDLLGRINDVIRELSKLSGESQSTAFGDIAQTKGARQALIGAGIEIDPTRSIVEQARSAGLDFDTQSPGEKRSVTINNNIIGSAANIDSLGSKLAFQLNTQ